mmetsp:Transcript_9153/g.26240  ORF Transcript_9153/g.26240 Transcript_9153/m.26240 type:complete len:441 (+) Transcript_9153:226-1548(+)
MMLQQALLAPHQAISSAGLARGRAGLEIWAPHLHSAKRRVAMLSARAGVGGWDDDSDDGPGVWDDPAAADGGAWGRGQTKDQTAVKRRSSGSAAGGGWGRGSDGGSDVEPRRDWRSREAGGRGGWRSGRDQGAREGEWGGRGRGRRDQGGSRTLPDGSKFYDAQPPKSSFLSKLNGEVLYGVAPVLMALQKQRRELHTLYVQEGINMDNRKDGAAVSKAIGLAGSLGLGVEYISKHNLNMMSDNRPHQGLVLDCAPLDWATMDRFPAPPAPEPGSAPVLWLALDEVNDPQNLGAILRSAHFLGVTGVLGCKRNSAPLSGVVSKASAGAVEVMTIHSCSNLPKTLQDARDNGWQVLGAGAEAASMSCSTFVMDKPTILVVGNEGYGLRTNVRRACDKMIRVDGPAGMDTSDSSLTMAVDSLNVSVATGVLLHSLLMSAGRA